MSVSLRPSSSLGFNRPLTQLVKRTLTVTNNNEQPVAFKVKTTAPKLYCVRPNSGRIEPGESVDVQVLLQAMKEEPPVNAKCKDKFLVQSTIITPEKEAYSLHDLWSSIDGEEATVHQQKIKVQYLPPIGQELAEEDENPSSFMDNSAHYDTVRETPDKGLNGHPDISFPTEPHPPLDRAFSPAVGDYAVPDEEEEIEEPVHHIPAQHVPMEVRPMHPVAQPSITSGDDDLRAQLSTAQAEIQRLRVLLETVPEPSNDDSGIRRRRVLSDTATAVSDGGETDVGTMVESATLQPEGVPPQMVVGISLMVFILTYLFF